MSLTVAALLAGPAAAPAVAIETMEERLRECAAIRSDRKRLGCFDDLAAATARPAAPGVASDASAAAPADAPPVAAAPPPPAAPEPASGGASMIITEDDFGLESQRIQEGTQEISTRYDGDFTGWTGKTLFRLENGQVWKQAQSGRVSFRATRPVITIRRGALGSFRLSVEGLNRTVRVTRIK